MKQAVNIPGIGNGDIQKPEDAAKIVRTGRIQDVEDGLSEFPHVIVNQARLLGYASFADYVLADTMAGSRDAARGLLDAVWAAARPRALAERDALQAVVHAEGGNFRLAPWDWRYYAEKLRKARHDLDEADLKPYLALDNIIAAAFHAAERLFGLTFVARSDVPARVAINEYVEIAHAFFSGKEPGMVNGVLDRLARTLRGAELTGTGRDGGTQAR